MSNKDNEKRVPYSIKFEEHEPFNPMSDTKWILSTEFVNNVAELFKGIFEDCEGCGLDVSGNELSVSVFFNHNQYAEDAHRGCEPIGTAAGNVNSIINRRNRIDRQYNDGNRYYVTEDGKDILADLLLNKFTKRNGTIDWKNVCCEYSEPQPWGVQNTIIYTKIGGIDPAKLCSLIYGAKNEDSAEKDFWDYKVRIITPLQNPGQMFNNANTNSLRYMLGIDRASSKEVASVFAKLGINASQSSIVRPMK